MPRNHAWFVFLALVGAHLLFAGVSAIAESAPGAAGTGAGSQPSYQDPDQLQVLITTRPEPYYLVDVRTPQEYNLGHVPTAMNIPYDVIAAQPPTSDKSALIIVYCESGGRSAKAKQSLDNLGYLRVIDFGGVSRWKGSSITGADAGDCPCRVHY
ncbi:MAG TPA: rhodanese-like domain-containing protein [Spirochaetia bacterium]|nr:rhodanese-like domain-containing protein [Spirochaetia bacterium]